MIRRPASDASRTLLRTFTTGALALAVAACGESTSGGGGQVAAKVGEQEISVHQVNFVAQRMPANLPPERIAQVRKRIAETLVEQQMLVSQAVEQKLDRDPAVVAQIESSRREILSRAYLERVASQVGAPPADEVKTYLAKHPELFEKRRVYRFDEIVLPSTPADLAALEVALEKVSSVKQAAAVLRQRGLDLPIQQGVVRGAETLPMDMLPALQAHKVGDTIVYRAAPRVVIAQITDISEAPVEAAKVQPMVEQFLANRRKQAALADEMKRLKEVTKVAWLGEFADAGKPSAAPAAGTVTAGEATTISKGEAAPATAAGTKADDDAIGRGIKGMK